MKKNVCEEKIFNSIFFEQSEKIRNFIYYKSGDLKLSEDLVQEAFIKLWNNCAKVEISKAKSYLYTVVNNLFLNQISHDKVVLKFKNNTQDRSENQSPEFILEEKEFKQQLENAINSLNEDQRVVFLMNRIDKMKYREMSEELGISIKAVEKRMHKALTHLREIHKNV